MHQDGRKNRRMGGKKKVNAIDRKGEVGKDYGQEGIRPIISYRSAHCN